MSKIKFYLGDIVTLNGEIETCTTVRFKTSENPDDYLDKLASQFWGDGEAADDWWWRFDNGVATEARGFIEVSEGVYEKVGRLIPQIEVH